MDNDKAIIEKDKDDSTGKKKESLFYIILFAVFIICISILFKNFSNTPLTEYADDKTDYFAEVACHFIDYEKLDDRGHVTFIRSDGEICAYIAIDNLARSGNLTAYLEPGTYCAVNGQYDGYLEFEIKDVSEQYILEIDCNDGRMELKKAQLAYVNCNFTNYEMLEETQYVVFKSEELGFTASCSVDSEEQYEYAYLIAGRYRITNSITDEMIETEIKEGTEYTLDMDWKDGSMKFIRVK